MAEGPLDALARRTAAREFLGYDTTEADGEGRRHHRRQSSSSTRSTKSATPSRSASSSTRRRSTAKRRPGRRHRRHRRRAASTFEVIDTQKDGDLILHIGQLRSGQAQARRQASRPRSTPTAAPASAGPTRPRTSCTTPCRRRSATHAQQRGSKVEDDWLRFDFAHPKAVTAEELVADRGRRQRPRRRRRAGRRREVMPIAEAAQERGAMMLFGEKYPDRVRDGHDGRLQQRALRRHAPDQHRPGRPVPDRGRRAGRQGRPPRCGRHRPPGAGADPPDRVAGQGAGPVLKVPQVGGTAAARRTSCRRN